MGRPRTPCCALVAALWLGLTWGCHAGSQSAAPEAALHPETTKEKPRAVVGALPVIPFAPLSADPARKAKLASLAPRIQQLFEARALEDGVTGAGVGIVLEGEVVYLRGFGVRDVDSKAPVDERTVFRLGSVTKTITALAVMRLRDQGKLSLDAPAQPYSPLLGMLEPPTRDSPPITLRHLLTMTSGLPYDDVWGAVTFGYDDQELEAYLSRGVRMAGSPGSEYRYSNLGFALLGKVVEHVTQADFEHYMAREVFAPLGMTSSGFVTGELPRERLATGYTKQGEELVPEPVESDGVFAPAGGGYTSIADLARYAAFQLAAYPARDAVETGAVRRSTVREMHQGRAWARWDESVPVVEVGDDGAPALTAASYGFGWMENTTCKAERMVQHGGFEPGYFASIRLLPRERIGVVTLSASGNLGRLTNFESLLELFEEAGVLQRPEAAAPAELVKARDIVLRMLQKWDPALVERSFDPQTQRYSFMRTWRDTIERVGRQHGPCHAEGEIVSVSPRQGRFRLLCERGALGVTAYLTPGDPPLFQMLQWRQELPVSEKQRAVAKKIASAIGTGRVPRTGLFAEKSRHTELATRLAREHLVHADCQLGQAEHDDGSGTAHFELECGKTRRELTFQLDDSNSLVTQLEVRTPRSFGATCVH